MFIFSDLLKSIRKEVGISQGELAKLLDVSTVLISKLESCEREPSKQFIKILATKLGVNPFSLTPFLAGDSIESFDSLSVIEKKFFEL